MELADIIAIAFGVAGTVFGFLGWRKAREANRLSGESNTIAWSSKSVAEDSNRIALDANEIAREANRVVTDDIEYRRERELEANLAKLEIPDENPIWVFNRKDHIARIGVHLLNKGAGEVRDLVMTAFVDESPLAVERGTIHKLT